jgi:hypothetical protein
MDVFQERLVAKDRDCRVTVEENDTIGDAVGKRVVDFFLGHVKGDLQ